MLTIEDLTPQEAHCPGCALKAIERRWGVVAEIYREWENDPEGEPICYLVTIIPSWEHRNELNGFMGIRTRMLPTRHYRLDDQYVSLIGMLNVAIHAHMTRL